MTAERGDDRGALRPGRMRERVLLANVLVVAACALVYELLCGTLASYLLGDAVLQFSLVLGTYLFAMGAGAWLSKRFEPTAASRYVQAELVLAAVGGMAVPALLLAFAARLPLRPLLHAIVFLVGTLVGLELPLLVRILRDGGTDTRATADRAPNPNALHDHADHFDRVDQPDHLNQLDQVDQSITKHQPVPDKGAGRAAASPTPPGADEPSPSSLPSPPLPSPRPGPAPASAQPPRFGETVARAFAFDYLGALAASLLFPLVLVPRLGLVRTSVVTGMLNVVAALSATAIVPVRHRQTVRLAGLLVLALLAVTFLRGEAWTASATD